MERELNIQVHAEDGSLWATVDEYPGLFATGDDIDELRESVADGLALVVEPGEHRFAANIHMASVQIDIRAVATA